MKEELPNLPSLPIEVPYQPPGPEPLNIVIRCKNTGLPLLYRKDKAGFFIACEAYPKCNCAITLKGM